MSDAWPPLPLSDWADTCTTLHMWTQIVGKVRLALAPRENHWWHVPFYVTTCGLTTSPMPIDGGTCAISFDFVAHQLVFDMSDRSRRTIDLVPQTVADFYAAVVRVLKDLGVDVRIWPMPVEVLSPVRFDTDRGHASYDRGAVERWWRIVRDVDSILKEFRGAFLGKSSPVHFFWGSFDLAATRFSGRPAPPREGADAITREAYSHEVISVGFWPGSGPLQEPAFYAYAAPEPPGFRTAAIQPGAAFYSPEFGEYLLRYEDVRRSSSPRDMLLAFCRSTFDAGASLGGWDRALVR